MKNGLGTTVKIIGIVLTVVGIGFAVWGFSGSVDSQVTQVVTDAEADKVMTYYIFGTASFVLGVFLFSKSKILRLYKMRFQGTMFREKSY